MNSSTDMSEKLALESAQRTLDIEIQALETLKARLGRPFAQAVEMLLACEGRAVVTGLGKSGHVARKIAATLASTGTPAFFMHGAEAIHGDLGMITSNDVLIAISYSGTAPELVAVLTYARRMGLPFIAISGHPESELAQAADLHLDVQVEQEACPLNLAPTASTTATMALGDALAVACLEARGFNAEDFARSHPGGALGRRLLTRVRDLMRWGRSLPTVRPDTPIPSALEEMSRKGMGMVIIQDAQGRPTGIFTDGDLRRLLVSRGDVRQLPVSVGMSPNPRTISPDMLAAEAAKHMHDGRLSQMIVVDESGLLLGALHMHDLLAAKIL
ncbi:KpsF/GutQ family sugar-phosphate isomerase [Pusillimonas sp. CC-YST705]|uniref:KpsF/GutQ family sugar-phosphate isomerase n=1 Tax=Mesopusillimonas faecipullorum TaxID=2755040 RepID=A0ABS8CCV1_9BURK|nr:KpsF/GutQ family sugar-phosphate isomerase [Mesopusillimonas faecipullorum]MCB5363679.1 KpsF/GutQ family sugar-phosphate isomerase [Mesopusillimonas faecipullorum]